MKLRFDRFEIPGYWTNYERHPDLKKVAGANYPLCINCMARTLATYGFCEGLRDNKDLFFFPYIRAVNAWLFSDRTKSLSSYITSSFYYFICECARQCNTRKRKKGLEEYPISLDFSVPGMECPISEVIADPHQNVENKFELEETLSSVLKRIEEHEKIGTKMHYKRKWTTVSYWTIFKIWVLDNMTITDLYTQCVKMGYIKEGYNKKDLRKVLSYCRRVLEEEIKNGKLGSTD